MTTLYTWQYQNYKGSHTRYNHKSTHYMSDILSQVTWVHSMYICRNMHQYSYVTFTSTNKQTCQQTGWPAYMYAHATEPEIHRDTELERLQHTHKWHVQTDTKLGSCNLSATNGEHNSSACSLLFRKDPKFNPTKPQRYQINKYRCLGTDHIHNKAAASVTFVSLLTGADPVGTGATVGAVVEAQVQVQLAPRAWRAWATQALSVRAGPSFRAVQVTATNAAHTQVSFSLYLETNVL